MRKAGMLALAVGGLMYPGAASAGEIASHRVAYKIQLARAESSSAVQGLNGILALELKQTCTGESVAQVLQSQFWGHEGEMIEGVLTHSSTESADGLSFAFDLRNLIDGEVSQDFSGRAVRPSPGAAGEVTVSLEGAAPGVLPAEAVFPGEHLRRLVAAAEKGERVLSVVIFDGDEELRTFKAVAIIGKVSTTAPVNGRPKELKGLRRWPVSLSYYPMNSDLPTPDYEVSFGLYENGVSDDLVLDYGDYALKGELKELRFLDEPACVKR